MSQSDSDTRMLLTLQKYWGYDSFRPMQREIIASVLDGNDTLGLLPTGGGKSITFQVPALMLDGLTLVVTPLISLMKDQVDNLRERGVRALYLHAGLSRRETRLAIEKCALGKIKILYLSPEKLQSQSFVDHLRRFPISLIVVDEAHCISQWGYDFRPSYLKIAEVRKLHPNVPVLALTASATPQVSKDIMAQLHFRHESIFTRSFKRDNLSYLVRKVDDKAPMLLRVLSSTRGSAIVYVRSRRRSREIAQMLQEAGISAGFYHAGLAPEEKSMRQEQWKSGQLRVMVATNAFGMGIDKPDVRVVVHVDIPTSLEEYYQEAGRAGRDGLPSFAVILATPADKALLTRRVNEAFPPEDYIRHVYEMAGNFLEMPVGEGYNSINEFDFNRFCFTFNLKPVPTHSALQLLTQAGYIEYVEEIATQSRVMVLVRRDDIYDLVLSENADRVLNILLRLYSGLFADYVYINEPTMALRLDMTEEHVYQSLLELSRMHIIHYVPRKSTPYYIYTTSRELPKYIMMPNAVYRDRRAQMEKRIQAMKSFVYDDDRCRNLTLLEYFGEKPESPCGICDVCRRERPTSRSKETMIADTILYQAGHPGGTTIDAVASALSIDVDTIIAVVRTLVDREQILFIPPSRITLR